MPSGATGYAFPEPFNIDCFQETRGEARTPVGLEVTMIPIVRFRRPDSSLLLVIALALIAAGMITVLHFTHGLFITGDSAVYVSVARNLVAGRGLVDYAGRYLLLWPPLYPILIAIATFGVLNPYIVTGPLNAVCYGLVVFVCCRWLSNRVETRFLVGWACLAMLLARPAFHALFLLSEVPFILFAISALLAMDRYRNSYKTAFLILSGVLTSLSFLTRYMGIAVGVSGFLLLLFDTRRLTPRRKLLPIVLYTAVSAIPPLTWVGYCFAMLGPSTGRGVSEFQFVDVLVAPLQVLTEWIFWIPYTDPLAELVYQATSFSLPDDIFLGATTVLVAAFTVVAVLACTGRRAGITDRQRSSIRTFGTFSVIYVCVLIGVLSVVENVQLPNTRTIYPIYYPTLMLGVIVTDWLHRHDQQHMASLQRILKPVLVGLLAIWAGVSGVGNIGKFIYLRDSGVLVLRSHESPTVRYVLDSIPPGAVVFANDIDEIALQADQLSAVDYLAASLEGVVNRRTIDDRFESFTGTSSPLQDARHPAYLVWFEGKPGYDVLPLEYDHTALGSLPGVEEVARLPDGIVFRLNDPSAGE